MFIQTESTPNPNSLKFLPGRSVLSGEPRDVPSRAAAAASPLAQALFEIDGVERVYFAAEFLTITKRADVEWIHLKPAALAAIMDHFISGAPLLRDTAARTPGGGPDGAGAWAGGVGAEATGSGDDPAYDGDAAAIVAEIKEIIETRVRPAVAQDGGDIVFRRFLPETGVVHLSMRGSCSGCPSSTMTLKAGIENMLKHYVPEVTLVEAVPE